MYITLKLLESDLKNLRNAGSKFTNILEVGVRETSSSYTSTPVSPIYLYTVCTSQYTIYMYPYTCVRGVYFRNSLANICRLKLCHFTLTIVFMIIIFSKIFFRQLR